MRLIYEPIPKMSREEIEAAIVDDEPDTLLLAVLSAALYAEDAAWAEHVCVQLARHPDRGVRGNAILGFGHIARIHGNLSRDTVQPLIEAGLADEDSFVRGQAENAASDTAMFLRWKIRRPASRSKPDRA